MSMASAQSLVELGLRKGHTNGMRYAEGVMGQSVILRLWTETFRTLRGRLLSKHNLRSVCDSWTSKSSNPWGADRARFAVLRLGTRGGMSGWAGNPGRPFETPQPLKCLPAIRGNPMRRRSYS